MPVTLRQLFQTIAGRGGRVTKKRLERFVSDAGVENQLFVPKASLAAKAFMDKFDDGTGKVTWDRFRTRGLGLLPPGMVQQTDAAKVAAELDARWAEIDPAGVGAVDGATIAAFLKQQLTAAGESFAGMKADAGAKVLVHALDENKDRQLQKEELHGFLLDVLREAKG